jgi:hypothetical protein
MAPGSAKVLEGVLKLVDKYDLYGRWADVDRSGRILTDLHLVCT